MIEEEDGVQYRFRWTLLGEAELILPNDASRYCAFSRAALKDHDLMKSVERIRQGNGEKSADKKIPQEQLCDVFGQKLNLDPEASSLYLSGHPKEPDETCTMDDEIQKMAALGLPVEFWQPRMERKKRKGKKRKIPGSTWMIGLGFDSYWDMAGEYIMNQTWLNDYGSQMDESVREQFRHSTMKCKPEDLIERHRDLKGYANIVYSTDTEREYVTWEDLYSRHCQLVKQRAKLDFEKQRQRSALNRCKQFLEKVKGLQFVPGCDLISLPDGTSFIDADVGSNDKFEDPTSQAAENISESVNSVEPSAKSCNDLEVFNDVYADFYSDSHTTRPLVFDDNTATHSDLPCTVSHQEVTESGQEQPLMMEGKLSFDFGFDPERDANLIAKNCFSTFANDPEMKKYMYQRFRLFSRFDEGVLMDRDGWFSVTPERMAEHIADRMVRREGAVIIDAFTGVGGNAIQFALKGAFVIAIDLDPVRLRCATRNAQVYGVADRINFICTDFFHFARSPRVRLPLVEDNEQEEVGRSQEGTVERYPVDAVFLSPPWGGPSYLKMKEFDISTHLTPNGFEIFRVARGLSPNIAYFLPRQTTVTQLVSLAGPGGSCEIEQNLLNSKIKAVTAYYGNLITGR
uniref:Trimethylguanosine synthase n=1 Tax=Parascaris univalens TaxID=6257 RepID=A0A915A071_PARUN